MMTMRLRVCCFLLGLRVRQALTRTEPGQALGLAVAFFALMAVASGFIIAIVVARHGPCARELSYSGGRPHWVLACGRRQP
jgi:hypothetical protein